MNELSNSQLKERARLAGRKFRQLEGCVIVEGERCLAQLAAVGMKPRELYLAPNAPPGHLITALVDVEATYTVTLRQLERLSRSVSPPPIAALFDTLSPPLPERGLLLYLDGIRDPGNLGAILRSAVALGAAGVALSPDCCEVFNPKVVQSALGAPFYFACQTRDRDWATAFAGAVLAADMRGTPLSEAPSITGDALLVIGSEAHGVSDTLLQRADARLSIPLSGRMESLNAAVAAGILLYALASAC
ncbi:MAG: RNA methyltransferase [Candidatus Cloacimonetes bacterium]|nr:RNA methyltransferase [Candidatus Cloacimonadota bacterium]